MKVLAINSSPATKRSNTGLILTPFLKGMEEAGAEVELIYTRKMNLKSCQGCFYCFLKKPGVCALKDDGNELLKKLKEADIWVLATPVHNNGISSQMSVVLERMLPTIQPFFEIRNGHTVHPQQKGYKKGKVVLVSSCAFWEMDNFDDIIGRIKSVCRNTSQEFAGALLRPQAPALKLLNKKGIGVDDIYWASRKAGYYLVKNGRIPHWTRLIISRRLLPARSIYNYVVNQFFKKELMKLKS